MKRRKHIALLLCFILSCGLLSGCGSNTPEKTAETFFSGVKYGDIDKSIECFTPAIQQTWKLGAALGNTIGGLFGIGDSSSIASSIMGIYNSDYYKDYDFKVQSAEYSSDETASVQVDVFQNGEYQFTDTLEMVKIDGEWKISK